MAGDPSQRSAEAAAGKPKAFYLHLALYVVVVGGLIVIDASTGGGWWVQWVALGWGLVVLAHGVIHLRSGPAAERRKQKLVERSAAVRRNQMGAPPDELRQKVRKGPDYPV